MQCRTFLFIVLTGLPVLQLRAQDPRIRAAETRLTETRELVFEDSIVSRYTIEQRMRFYKIPSVSVAVIDGGRVVWTRAYGYADAGSRRKATVNTLYQVASITKSVTGLALLKLVEAGRLSLDADIRSYLKSWRFPDNTFSEGRPVTIRQLLSHTAGLNVHGFIGYSATDSLPTINQILNGESPANSEAVRPVFPVGTQFEYSGGGYAVLRKILDDQLSGNYDSLMQALVLGPLHLRRSSFSLPLSASWKDIALGHDRDALPLPGGYYRYPEKAAGGMWSTAGDIARIILRIQQDLRGGPSPYLSKTSVQELLRPVLNNYALGFGILERGGERYFWHEGESYGYNAIYYGSFSSGRGVVVLTNAYPENGQPFLRELVNSVATAYGWPDFYKPVRKKLAKLLPAQLAQYAGEYISTDPPVTIRVTAEEGELYLMARRKERMYPLGNDRFFLASAPDDLVVFSASEDKGVLNTVEVVKSGAVIIRAKRGKQ